MLKKYGWIALFAAFLLVFWLGQQSTSQNPVASAPVVEHSRPEIQSPPAAASLTHDDVVQKTNNLPDFLPAEAKTTLDLIFKGGPFPYRQDGVVFQNREKRLPGQPRGHYHEYTVETPGLNHRGARRIITGGNPVVIYYYTDDHYDSFREFEVKP
ncbi:MAG: ribonuclease domain-containing protein [Arenimonas sp.]